VIRVPPSGMLAIALFSWIYDVRVSQLFIRCIYTTVTTCSWELSRITGINMSDLQACRASLRVNQRFTLRTAIKVHIWDCYNPLIDNCMEPLQANFVNFI
jgi:hypothetical protein